MALLGSQLLLQKDAQAVLINHYAGMAITNKGLMLRGIELVATGEPLHTFLGRKSLSSRAFQHRKQVCILVMGHTDGERNRDSVQ